jgi:hypothetical protein
MDRTFDGARLKIERANKHIADVEARLSALAQSYVVRIKRNPALGNEVIEHDLTDRNAGVELALLIGDAIHNLHCALDYGCVERVAPEQVDKFAKFPVYSTLKALEGALKGRKIDVASPKLYALIVSQIKPYHAGHFDLWAIHKLDISDKHRLLIPVVGLGAVDGIELEDKAGGTETIKDGWTPAQPPPIRIPIPLGYHIKNNGKFSVEVIFDEGTPVESLEVSDTLSRFSRVVVQVVEQLESVM